MSAPPPTPPASDWEKPPRPKSLTQLSPVVRKTSTGSAISDGSPRMTISWDNSIDTGNHERVDSSLASLEELMNKDDQAERGLLSSMEQRRTTTQTSGGDVWHASVQGERPPLGGAVPLEFQNMLHTSHNDSVHISTRSQRSQDGSQGSRTSSHTSQGSATKLADIARRMRQKAGAPETAATSSFSTNSSTPTPAHRRAPSRASVLLESIKESNDESNNNLFDGVGNGGSDAPETSEVVQAANSTEKLLAGAMQVEDLFDQSPPAPPSELPPVEEQEPLTAETVHEFEDDDELVGENVPLMASPSYRPSSTRSSIHTIPPPYYNTPQTDSPKVLRQKSGVQKKKSSWWWWQCICFVCGHPLELWEKFWDLLWYRSFLLTICMPCFIGAAILFYGLEDPMWNFLPGHASVAWWLNFLGRQVLLLELARIWQWLFIDKLVLGTRIAVQCLGPLLTLCLIQARGWPFCAASWGFFDLMLLEGRGQFEQHWLYFSPFSLYGDTQNDTENDSGNYVLSSDIYVRLLLSMMLAGFATAIKRTAVAMYFGRRTFVEFKPRLEKLLKDVVLVTEMAALAEEAEIAAAEEEQQKRLAARRHSRTVLTDTGGSKVNLLGDVSWSKKSRRKSNASITGRPQTVPATATGEDASDSDDEDDDDEDDESEITTQNDIRPEAERSMDFRDRTDSGSLRVRDLLGHWEEPVNRMDKSLNASISDILRFRRALTFMDDEQPFGETFGPASNRDQLIDSAHSVYHRLLMLTPGRNKVSCEFYDMLALENDGETVNIGKRKALRKLFRPDANNELSLLAFVQCCDSLYKKLRYFRANVGNASVIDHALESIVDGAFSFVLALVLLSVMRVNPWPLLVSISTLLVSISFAVGSSASKWFEGMLLVAARRPFDLGDRIYMNDPSTIITDGLWYCWFVEDINLFHTTVRYAGTNEVATINNGSVANLRIINGSRSPNAAVWFQFPFRANLMEDGNLDNLKAALENYAKENPRNWHSYSYCRVDEVHPDIEKLVVTIGMQHRSAWQDLVTILEAKAKIMCWVMEYGRKQGIIYDELPKRDLLYYAGALKDGSAGPHRFHLHNPSNITSGGFPVPTTNDNESASRSATPKESSDAKFLQQLMQSHG